MTDTEFDKWFEDVINQLVEEDKEILIALS
jgi:hypothetical protein